MLPAAGKGYQCSGEPTTVLYLRQCSCGDTLSEVLDTMREQLRWAKAARASDGIERLLAASMLLEVTLVAGESA